MCTNIACDEHVDSTQIQQSSLEKSKVQMKQYEICGVKIYTIQKCQIKKLTLIPLGFSLKRVNEYLLCNVMFKITVTTRTKDACDGNMIKRVGRLVEVGCNRSTR